MVVIAQYGMLFLLPALWIFHLLVLLKIIPYNIVFGSRIKSDKQMYFFEMISIVTTSGMLFIILIYSEFIFASFPKNILSIILWVMVGLFSINAIANIRSENKYERLVFTPLAILAAIFTLILAIQL